MPNLTGAHAELQKNLTSKLAAQQLQQDGVHRIAVVFLSDPEDAAFFAKCLKADACHVEVAHCWEEVMALLDEGITPALTICDLHLFGKKGERALKLLADMWPKASAIAVVDAISAKNTLIAMRAGAADCLTRPIKQEELTLAISRALERARLLTENTLYQGELEQAHIQLKQHFAELELDQRTGRSVQMSMLPPSPMKFGQYKFMHQMLPSLFLSADFVDYFQITDQYLAFYVADVSGHGSGSALITVLLKNFSRRFRREHSENMLNDPAAVLHWLNQDLVEHALGRHTTMFLGIVDTYDNKLHYANAGHFPNPMLASSEACEVLDMPSQPLGLSLKAVYQSATISLPEAFVMTLFTDGVLEVMEQQSLAQKEASLINATRQLPDSLESVWKLLGRHTQELLSSGEHLPDDLCGLLVTNIG